MRGRTDKWQSYDSTGLDDRELVNDRLLRPAMYTSVTAGNDLI